MNSTTNTKITKCIGLIIFIGIIIACKQSNPDKNTSQLLTDTTQLTISAINRLLNKEPKNASLWHKRALYYLKERKPDSAISDVKQAILLDSTKAGFYLTLADCYLIKNQSSLTRTMLLKALSVDSLNIDALLKLSELHLYVRLYDDAFNYVNKALRVDNTNAKAYFIKGILFLETGDTLRAVSSFKTTVEQDPDYYHAYILLGNLYALRGDTIAEDYYNNALNLNPKSEEAYYNLGQYYMNKGRYNKAIEQLTMATTLNPKSSDSYYALGYIHYEYLKVYSEALKYFIKSAEANPRNYKAVFMIGLTYETLGDIKNASKYYSQCIAINPTYEKAKAGLKRVNS
jgi:tetratricopeptide (TPR) repeat protein